MRAYKFVQVFILVFWVSACHLAGTCKVGAAGDCSPNTYCEDSKGLQVGNEGICVKMSPGACEIGAESGPTACGNNEECVPNAEDSTEGTCQPLPQPLPQPRLTSVQFSSDCRSMELSGEPGIQAPATYASSLGSMDTLCPEGVSGEETGFRCTLDATHLAPGTHVAQWTVEDSLGGKTTTSAYAFQTILANTEAMFPMELMHPSAVLGLDTMVGHQVLPNDTSLSTEGCWWGTSLRGSIAVGYEHACALQADGTVQCWGKENRQTNVPETLELVVAIAAGNWHTCALKSGGTVVCWGYNSYGVSTPPWDLDPVVAIAAGSEHTCVLEAEGTVRCWGNDAYGQLTPPEDLESVVALAAGGLQTCALQANGTVRCWGGHNYYGQLTPPEDLESVVALAAGDEHICALQANGTVRCWGNSSGATPPGNLGPVVALAAGEYHTCALQADGMVRCWGNNRFDALNIPKLSPVVALAAGYWYTCALQTGGTVRCWGENNNSQLLPAPPEQNAAVQTVGQLVIVQ